MTCAHFFHCSLFIFQRPDLARLMQMHAQATAGQLQAGPTGLPPGLLAGHPGAPPGGIPASLSLLNGIPTSLSTPHPAFASLLAQQKPAVPDPAVLMARSREEELKRESNGSKCDVLLHIVQHYLIVNEITCAKFSGTWENVVTLFT